MTDRERELEREVRSLRRQLDRAARAASPAIPTHKRNGRTGGRRGNGTRKEPHRAGSPAVAADDPAPVKKPGAVVRGSPEWRAKISEGMQRRRAAAAPQNVPAPSPAPVPKPEPVVATPAPEVEPDPAEKAIAPTPRVPPKVRLNAEQQKLLADYRAREARLEAERQAAAAGPATPAPPAEVRPRSRRDGDDARGPINPMRLSASDGPPPASFVPEGEAPSVQRYVPVWQRNREEGKRKAPSGVALAPSPNRRVAS